MSSNLHECIDLQLKPRKGLLFAKSILEFGYTIRVITELEHLNSMTKTYRKYVGFISKNVIDNKACLFRNKGGWKTFMPKLICSTLFSASYNETVIYLLRAVLYTQSKSRTIFFFLLISLKKNKIKMVG